MMVYDVAVIGGGASGMVAAIVAKRGGAKVILIEGGPRLGKKILATGNGKCNALPGRYDINRYNSPFVGEIFNAHKIEDIISFFDEIGVPMREVDGRFYPHSLQASAVQNALRQEVERLGIIVAIDTKITKISHNSCFELQSEGERILAKKVILSVGSPAGFGIDSVDLYLPFGHKKRDFMPSLCPIITDKKSVKGLRGVRTEVSLKLVSNGTQIAQSRDEILFKDNGVSGTAVFNVSVALARLGKKDFKNTYLEVDFAPDYDEGKLTESVAKYIKGGMSLEGLLHKEIIRNILEETRQEVPYGKGNKDITQCAKTLTRCIKSYRIDVFSLGSFELAQVASGGLLTVDFDNITLESKKQRGLFATGEALDVDGECGGYNLYWAWASGMSAAESALKN